MTSVFGGKKAGLEIYRALGIKASQMWNGLNGLRIPLMLQTQSE